MPKAPDAKTKKAEQPPARRSMLELRLPSDTRYLHMVRELARRLAESTGFEPLEAEKIAMAVDEATTNVMQHAYKGAEDREIEIHFDPEGESLDVLILHDGEPLGQVPMPGFDLDKLVAERRKGGMGIYIMRQMMDDLRFGKAGSGKNMCVMVRYKERKPKRK
jgi:anti-sigma regulatory factor (Ser/Thr protein kinase)